MIVTTGFRINEVTTRAYTDDGVPLWTADYGADTKCVVIDNDGNVLVGGRDGIKKYSINGVFLLHILAGTSFYAIAVDSSGNIFTAGPVSFGYTNRKLTPGGDVVWQINRTIAMYSVAVDSNNDVYTSGGWNSGYITVKYSNAGTLLWGADDAYNVRGVAVRGTKVVTGGIYYNYGQTIRVYDISGNYQWGRSYYSINAVAIDSAGNIYTGGPPLNTTYEAVRKYTGAGGSLWTKLPGYTINSVTVDGLDNVYVAGVRKNNATTHKYNSAGTLQYSLDHGTGVTGIAWFSPPLILVFPALYLVLGIGSPVNDLATVMPPFNYRIGLALPTYSDPPLPPDLAGIPVAKIYRAWVSTPGGSTLVEIPFASFQCTRRVNASTWLTMTTPGYTPGLVEQLAARIGGELVIDAGYRQADGVEQLGLFLQATVTAVEYERERGQATIRLTARVINPAYSTTSRTLYGIQNQNSDNGRMTVICETDPLLRPGDTVTAARGMAFTVGAIRYAVSPHGSIMELTESL